VIYRFHFCFIFAFKFNLCRYNKGKRHSPETIEKIRASTLRAMQDPDVRQKIRVAAEKHRHSETVKFRIRRSVRDNAHVKMHVRNKAKAEVGPQGQPDSISRSGQSAPSILGDFGRVGSVFGSFYPCDAASLFWV
jgi:hypothetical protein